MMRNNQPMQGRTTDVSPEMQQQMIDALAKALVQSAGGNQKAAEPAANQRATMEIDLLELFFMILSKIQYVIIAALLGAIFMGLQAGKAIPMYSATSKLYIVGNQGSSINISDLQMGAMLTMDYEEVFRTWEVHEMVRSQLGLNYTYNQLQSMISIGNPEDTRVLYITARNPDAQIAADIANAYATAAKTFILQTMDSEEPNIFSIALVPSVASRVSKSAEALKGFLLGSVLSVGLITLFFVLDERPRTPENIQRAADIPTLAVMPRLSQKQKNNSERKHRRHHNALS